MKFIKPDADARNSYSGRPPAYSPQERAIERGKVKYIKLECGHYTDWDTDLFYGHLDPLGPLTHWCQNCSEWIRKAEVKPVPLPDEPLF